MLLLLGRDLLGALATGTTLLREGEAEPEQQLEALLVGRRSRRQGDVEAPRLADRVVIDLREDKLLADAHRVVAAAVERAGVEPAEVADPGDRDRHQPVDELPHPGLAQGHRHADRHALAQLECGDRHAGAADVRALARDRRQLGRRLVERAGVARAHVDADLDEARRRHRRRVAELLHQSGQHLLLVVIAKPRRRGRPGLG